MTDTSSRIAEFREGVVRYYPQFRERAVDAPYVLSWQGVIRPFGGDSRIAALLEDLNSGDLIRVEGGRLVHYEGCHREHRVPAYLPPLRRLDQLFRLDSLFVVRVLLPPAPQHPRAISLYPEISWNKYPNHPHLSVLPQPREFGVVNTLCPYRPSEGVWAWETRTIVDYLDYVTLWLAKHVVWLRTGGTNGLGMWLGEGASHLPKDLVSEIPPQAPCHCGSGQAYRECHRDHDIAAARRVA